MRSTRPRDLATASPNRSIRCVLGAPEQRRLDAWRAGHVPEIDAEHLADEAVRRPRGQGDGAARAGRPGRSRRPSGWWSGANIVPNTDRTASNESVRRPAGPRRRPAGTRRRALRPRRAPARPPAAPARSRHRPRGRPTARRRGSRCRCRRRRRAPSDPARRSARSASCSLTSTIRAATTEKSPLAQVCCCLALIAGQVQVAWCYVVIVSLLVMAVE